MKEKKPPLTMKSLDERIKALEELKKKFDEIAPLIDRMDKLETNDELRRRSIAFIQSDIEALQPKPKKPSFLSRLMFWKGSK